MASFPSLPMPSVVHNQSCPSSSVSSAPADGVVQEDPAQRKHDDKQLPREIIHSGDTPAALIM
jgi:hypothetical protein